MDAQPRLERGVRVGRDRDLALDVALAADEQLVMDAVRPGAADRAHREGPQLAVAEPAVAHQPEHRVVALADQRAAVRGADQVAVLHRAERLGRPDLVRRDADVGGVVVEAELGEQRAEHRDVHAAGRRRGGPAAAAAVLLELAAVGGDRVRRSRRRRRAGGRARRAARRRSGCRSSGTAGRSTRGRRGRRSARRPRRGSPRAAARRRAAWGRRGRAPARGRARRRRRGRGYLRTWPSWLKKTRRPGRHPDGIRASSGVWVDRRGDGCL